MEKPCNKCIVRACCTERCIDYAIYIYKTREYAQAGDMVKHVIENQLTAGEAIQHILTIENAYLSIKMIALSPCSSTR